MKSILYHICLTLVGVCVAKEHTGARKSIIPRHKSEHNGLFHIVEPSAGVYKRSKLGQADDSGTLHLIENVLLGNIKKLEQSSKKSDVESKKEIGTIAEQEIGKGAHISKSQNGEGKSLVRGFGISITEEDVLKKILSESSSDSEKKTHIDVKSKDVKMTQSKPKKDIKTIGSPGGATGDKKPEVKGGKKESQQKQQAASKRDQTKNGEHEDEGEYGSSPGNPAMSCSDLFTKFPNLPSGSYWIQTADRKEKMLLFCEKNVEYIKPKLDSGKEWKPKSDAGPGSSGLLGGVKADPVQQMPKVIVHPVVGDHLTMGNNTGLIAGPEDPDQLKDGMWPYESVTKILPDEAVKNASELKLPPLPAPQPQIPAKEPNQATQSPTASLTNGTTEAVNETKKVTKEAGGAGNATTAPAAVGGNSTSNNSPTQGSGKGSSDGVKDKEKDTSSSNSTQAVKMDKDADNVKANSESVDGKPGPAGNQSGNVVAKTAPTKDQGTNEKKTDKADSNTTAEGDKKKVSKVDDKETTKVEGKEASKVDDKETTKVEGKETSKVEGKEAIKVDNKESSKVEGKEASKVEGKVSSKVEGKETSKVESKEASKVEGKETSKVEGKETSKVEGKETSKVEGKEASTAKIESNEAAKAGNAGSAPIGTPLVNPAIEVSNAEKEASAGKLVNPAAPPQKANQNTGLTNVKDPESKQPDPEKAKLVQPNGGGKPNPAVNARPVPENVAGTNIAPNKDLAQAKPVPNTNQAPQQSNVASLEDLFADMDNKEQPAAQLKTPVLGGPVPGNGVPNTIQAPSAPSDGYLEQPGLGLNSLAKPGGQAVAANKPAVVGIGPGKNNPNSAQTPSNPLVSIAEQPGQAQVPEMTHDKMIQLSSPPITSLGLTNVASEKDLSLPSDYHQMKPGNIVSQFMPGAKPGPTVKPNTATVSGGLVVTKQPMKPTAPPAVTKGAPTPLRPTLSQKKKPETLEEFETERQKSSGISPNLENGAMKQGLNDVVGFLGEGGKGNESWVDDSAFGLLGDTPWARDKAPGVAKKKEVEKKVEKEVEKAVGKEVEKEGKGGKKEEEKDSKKTDEKKEEKVEAGDEKKNGSSKEKDSEIAKDSLKDTDKANNGTIKNEKETNSTKLKVEQKKDAKTTEEAKVKENKNETKVDNGKSPLNVTDGATGNGGAKDVEKVDDKSKQSDNKTAATGDKEKHVEEAQKNKTSNVLSSKANYQYIENKTTALDNYEYHDALSKNNATKVAAESKNSDNKQEESKQAQNLVPSTNQGAALSPVGFQATQNIQNPKANTSVPMASNEQSTAFGNIHQIPATFPVNSALPLAALPINAPPQGDPQFFVSSPVSNTSTTTTTTSLLPVDPVTGDRTLNTSLALVSVKGDEGTIPESQFLGSDQVDLRKNNAGGKESTKAITKTFIQPTGFKKPGLIRFTQVGKKKSDIKLKPEQKTVTEKTNGKGKKNGKSQNLSEKVMDFFTVEQKVKKSNTMGKLNKALEGTNVTIQNGVSTHMTFKSFVPRLSVDDVIDEQKRSSIPGHGKKEKGLKRSWEKKLGKIMGAVEGSNFSIENSVNSHLTLKSDITPIKLSTHDSKGRKAKQSHELEEKANSKGEEKKSGSNIHTWANKAQQKKKPEKVPYESRNSPKNGNEKRASKKERSQASNQKAIGKKAEKKEPKESKRRTKPKTKSQGKEKREYKRSGISNSIFQKKKGEESNAVKGNHSEASVVSSFTDSKAAKESKSITLTNANKDGVQQGVDQNGTLNVAAKEGMAKAGNTSNSSREKQNESQQNATSEDASAANVTKGFNSENSTVGKNETSKKPFDRGVFEPDIGTMKKQPKTTDIKHHISTNDNKTDHANEAKPEKLLEGKVAEQKIDSNNTLRAVYNVRKIEDKKSGNESITLPDVGNYHIDENNTLHAVYNVKPLVANNSTENSTAKLLVTNLAGYQINNKSVLNAVYNIKRVDNNETIAHNQNTGQGGTARGHIPKASAQRPVQSKSSKDASKKVKRTRKQKKMLPTGKALKSSPTSAKHWHSTGSKKVHSQRDNGKLLPTEVLKSEKKTVKNSSTKGKDEEQNKLSEKVNAIMQMTGQVIKMTKKLNRRDKKGKSVKIVIKGKSKNAELKNLRQIGLVIPLAKGKGPKKISDKKKGGGRKAEELQAGKAKQEKKGSEMKKNHARKGGKGMAEDTGLTGGSGEGIAKSLVSRRTKTKQARIAQPTRPLNKGTSKNYRPTSKNTNPTGTRKNNFKKKNGPIQKMNGSMTPTKSTTNKSGRKEKLAKKAKAVFGKDVKIKKMSNVRKMKNVSYRKEKSKKGKKEEKVDEYEKQLEQKEGKKKVRTIFFPQVFMKREKVPRPTNEFKAKGRQLIPTKVGDIEPSKGPEPPSEATSQDGGVKSSERPSGDSSNGNGTNPGNALYAASENKKEGTNPQSNGNNTNNNNNNINNNNSSNSNQTTENNNNQAIESNSSKNTLDVSDESINSVLNMTVGFLNKTFHDQFGKGLKSKHITELANGTAAGANGTQNSGVNSPTNGTVASNGTSQNATGNGGALPGVSNNTTANATSNGAIVSEGAGNNSMLQNATHGGNGVNGNSTVGNSIAPNPKNATVNGTALPLVKEHNVTEGFRSERIPGVSKAAAVSDMMSPVENYILNMINETGAKHFGNQSSTEGKRGSSMETQSKGGNDVGSLLSQIKSGRLNLKSNQVSINLTPKKAVNSFSNGASITAGAGLQMSLANKRSTLSKKTAAKAQAGSSKKKAKENGDKKKAEGDGNRLLEDIKKEITKMLSNDEATEKESTAATTKANEIKQKEKPKKKKKAAKKESKKQAGEAKSGIRFATSHQGQKITTFSSGSKNVAFSKGSSSDVTMNNLSGKEVKTPNKKGAALVTKPSKGGLRSAQPSISQLKKKTEKNASKPTAKDQHKVAPTKEKEKSKDKASVKNKKAKKLTKRQNSSDQKNSASKQESGFPLKINGTKNDWGPVSENWPNFSLG